MLRTWCCGGPTPRRTAPTASPICICPQASGRTRAAPVLVALHGGFWRQEYDRRHLRPLAVALRGLGLAGGAARVPARRLGGRRRRPPRPCAGGCPACWPSWRPDAQPRVRRPCSGTPQAASWRSGGRSTPRRPSGRSGSSPSRRSPTSPPRTPTTWTPGRWPRCSAAAPGEVRTPTAAPTSPPGCAPASGRAARWSVLHGTDDRQVPVALRRADAGCGRPDPARRRALRADRSAVGRLARRGGRAAAAERTATA